MFEQCRAFIVATTPAESRVLELMAQQLGFGEIVSAIGGAQGNVRAQLTFFFVDYRLAEQMMADAIETIREDHRGKLCYSPILLFTDDGSTFNTRKYVRFGFDDVIELPASRDELVSRLAAQLNSDFLYLETKDYFGPDRRRMDAGAGLRVGASAYTQVLFERDSRRGVHVIAREKRGHRFRPQPNEATHFVPKLFGQAAR
jgi:DNA-binding response OmpR family regulator